MKANCTCLFATMTIGTLLSRSSPSTLCSSLKDSGSRFSSAESTTNISIHVSWMKLDQYLRIACEPPTTSTVTSITLHKKLRHREGHSVSVVLSWRTL